MINCFNDSLPKETRLKVNLALEHELTKTYKAIKAMKSIKAIKTNKPKKITL